MEDRAFKVNLLII